MQKYHYDKPADVSGNILCVGDSVLIYKTGAWEQHGEVRSKFSKFPYPAQTLGFSIYKGNQRHLRCMTQPNMKILYDNPRHHYASA